MRTLPLYWFLVFIFIPVQSILRGQDLRLEGQASGWLSHAASAATIGFRYLPELSLSRQIFDEITGTIDGAANFYSSFRISGANTPQTFSTVKPYRLWGRIAADQYELRIGLQKINFGPAVLFRPLMWFDSMDPRDPLQWTDGVYAILGRYYFPDNSNLWMWVLYGNNERKGMEAVPSKMNSVEFGGRAQIPLWEGEIAASFHHRTADLITVAAPLSETEENRYAIDGKWDAGIGLWFEIVFTHRALAPEPFLLQRVWTAGADYTIGVGNGLTVLTEYFRTESLRSSFAPSGGNGFSSFSLAYPLSIIDRISVIVYRDWTNNLWYRLVSAQRSYDDWIISLIGFWNPSGPVTASGSNSFTGAGAQLLLMFNH